ERHDAAGVDLHHFAGGKRKLDKVAAGVDEDGARAGELFENESFAAEESRAEPLHQRDIQPDACLGHHKGIALHEDALTRLEFERLDASWITAREPDLAGRGRAEVGQEQRFAHQLALESSQEFFAQGLAAHASFPGDLRLLINHFPGFGVELLSWLEPDTDHLKVVALDGVFERRMRDGWNPCGHRRSVSDLRPAVGAESSRIRKLTAAIDTKSHIVLG